MLIYLSVISIIENKNTKNGFTKVYSLNYKNQIKRDDFISFHLMILKIDLTRHYT